MKTKFSIFLLISILLGVFWIGCQEQITQPDNQLKNYNQPYSLSKVIQPYPLYAGQDILVGVVNVSDDGTDLSVEFVVNAPWCLVETHLAVAIQGEVVETEGIPQTKKGNPIPGKFKYSDENPECDGDTYTISLEEFGGCGADLVIAAHAVVTDLSSCNSEAVLYGVERGTGDLYTIDVIGGTAALLRDIDDPAIGNVNSPNGLAYDATTGRLYFSAYEGEGVTECELYFYDGTNVTPAETVPGLVAGATFYNGEYYYRGQ